MTAALLDALVVVAAAWAASRARTLSLSTVAWGAGLALVALAAAVGTVRYAGWPALSRAHEVASTVATVVGMPALLLGGAAQPGFRAPGRRPAIAWGVTGVAVAAFAAIVVDGDGAWRGVPREQLFHVLFAAALGCLGRSFSLARR